MSLLKCANETINLIIHYVSDRKTIANVALTCKTLNLLASPILYESCPELDEVGCGMEQLHNTVQILLKNLSPQTATFIHHLVLDPRTNPKDPDISEKLIQCSNLQKLTLHLAGNWAADEVQKYLMHHFYQSPPFHYESSPMKIIDLGSTAVVRINLNQAPSLSKRGYLTFSGTSID